MCVCFRIIVSFIIYGRLFFNLIFFEFRIGIIFLLLFFGLNFVFEFECLILGKRSKSVRFLVF